MKLRLALCGILIGLVAVAVASRMPSPDQPIQSFAPVPMETPAQHDLKVGGPVPICDPVNPDPHECCDNMYPPPQGCPALYSKKAPKQVARRKEAAQ